ncbi:MAG TPA: tetratricopeptide repeat protein, partial [Pyrinomonadaceae bacterium]|nr:tetratricopeptide repeat protein [Pyrinomonadaceae bacterium]
MSFRRSQLKTYTPGRQAAALVVCLLLSTYAAGQTNDGAQKTAVLLPGQPVAKELRGGQRAEFRVVARAGEFFRVRVEQQGIDLVVALSDPAGRQLLEVVRQSDTVVPEPVVANAEVAGVYTLSVRARDKSAPAGRYEVELEELRAATAQDEYRVAAERAAARGAQLQYGEGTADAVHRALTEYETAYKAWQAAGDSREVARMLGSLGAAYSSLREYKSAIDYYQRAADLLHTLGATKQEAGVAENIGWLAYHELGDKQPALAALARALKLYEDMGAQGNAARTRTIIGMVYTDLGSDADERRKALTYLNTALADERALRNPYAEGDALSNLMSAWKNLQRPDTAIFYGKQAIDVYQTLRARLRSLALEPDTQKTFLRAKADTYRTLADLLITQGRLPEAQQVLDMLKEEEYSDLLL